MEATVVPAAVTCDANHIRQTTFGERFVCCPVTLGLASFTDTTGVIRRYCAARGHRASVERRFERYVSEIADDPLGQAKARRETVEFPFGRHVADADLGR